MRTLLYLVLVCLFGPMLSAVGQEIQPAPPAAPVEIIPPPPAPAASPSPWNVRVEMLIAEVPQSQALALLPALRDDGKVEAAHDEILAAIARKEVTLVACPVLQTTSGNKATVETIQELIYPTQFQPPDSGQVMYTPGAAAISKGVSENLAITPTNFEKRNCGVTVEVEPVVRANGKWIDLNIQPQRVVFQGYEWFEALKSPTTSSAVPQPHFSTTKTSTSWAVRNGQWTLCGFHRLKQPEGQIEVDLIQVSAVRTDD